MAKSQLPSLYEPTELLSTFIDTVSEEQMLFQQEKRCCNSVPSSWFTDRLFDGFFFSFIYSLTYMLIFCQGRPQRALSKPSIFCFYCNINADKWNWLPLDQRPALLPALKGSCFLLIPWMHFYLFKYHSAWTVYLHEHTLTHQSWHFEALSDGSSFNGRLTKANVRTLSIVSA